MRVIALVLLLLGCASPFAPQSYTNYEAPTIYSQWWSEVEACSNLHGSLARIQWATTDDSIFMTICGNGFEAMGCWVKPYNIYVLKNLVTAQPLIKHEMLHDLLQVGGHPSPPFGVCA